MVTRPIPWSDVAERCLWTFVQAALGAWVVTNATDLVDADVAATAATAGIAAVASLLKSIAATQLGAPGAGTLRGASAPVEAAVDAPD